MNDAPLLVPDAPVTPPRRRSAAPLFEVLEGRKPESWQEAKCELPMWELWGYTDLLRALIVRLAEGTPPEVAPVRAEFLARVSRELSRWPGLLQGEELGDDIRPYLGMMPPTRENLALLQEFYDRLKAIETQPHVVPRGVKLGPGRSGPIKPGAEFSRRWREFEALLQRAISLNVVTQRGPWLYFGDRILGNGIAGAWRRVKDSELISEVRAAIARAERDGAA